MSSKQEPPVWHERLFAAMPSIIGKLVLFFGFGFVLFFGWAVLSDRDAAIIERVNQHNMAYIENALVACAGEARVVNDKPVVLISTQDSDLERALITTCVDAYLDGGAELENDHHLVSTVGDDSRFRSIFSAVNVSIETIATRKMVLLSAVDRDLPDLPAWSMEEANTAHGQLVAQSSALLDEYVRDLVGSNDKYVLISVGLLLAGIVIVTSWGGSSVATVVGLMLVAGAGVQLAKPVADIAYQYGEKSSIKQYMCSIEMCDDQVSQWEKEIYASGRAGCFEPEDGLAIDYKTRTVTISKHDEALTRQNWGCLAVPLEPPVTPNLHTFSNQSWTIIKTSGHETD